MSPDLATMYRRRAQTLACIPVPHPSLALLAPGSREQKHRMFVWRKHSVIVRSFCPPHAIWAHETLRVRFGYHPQNPGRQAARTVAARLTAFILPPSPGQLPHHHDVFLAWVRAAQTGHIRDILWQDVGTRDCHAALQIASRHHRQLVTGVLRTLAGHDPGSTAYLELLAILSP